MNQKIIVTSIIIFLSISAMCQFNKPMGFEIKYGANYDILDSKTVKYISNSYGFNSGYYFYIKDFFIGSSLTTTNTHFTDSLKIKNIIHLPKEKLGLDKSTLITAGYKFYLSENNISIDPYLGWLKTRFVSTEGEKVTYDSKKGVCLGFSINKYFQTKSEFFQYFIFFNNRINYSGLSRINDNLGNLIYSFEIGAGFDLGKNRR